MGSHSKKTVRSTCCYCGVGCGVHITCESEGTVKVVPDVNHPVNQGKLCSKGLNLEYTVNDRDDRLLYPIVRYNKHLPRQRVSWEEALRRTAAAFKTIIDQYGPDAVGFYASGQCLTEEYYVVNKLIKGFIGSNNIDTNSRLCMSSAVSAMKMSFGEDAVPICYDDIEQSNCILVAGANPAWCHPILWRRVEAHKQKNPEVKIIVIDPRVTDSCSVADLHLQINPGTDRVLNYAIGRILIEKGYIDADFIADHTQGFEEYKDVVYKTSLHDSANICGVDSQDIMLAASMIGKSNGFLTMWTMGLNQSANGVDKNLSLINLNLITGKIGKPGSGPFSLTGQPNAMGGREVGGLANLLPAHRDLANEDHRAEVQKFWGGKEIAEKPGLTATEMFEALHDGRLKAIWILCTNPLTSLPNARFVEKALERAKFVVVQEISNKPQTLDYADVILPAAAWGEKEGTMTNSERRISRVRKVIEPPGEARPDAEIICSFAKEMGFKGFEFENAEAIYKEHTKLTKKTNLHIDGLDYSDIDKKGTVQWPFYKRKGLSTKRLFTDGLFYTHNKRANIYSPQNELRSEMKSRHFPFILTTGRIRDQWHTMSKTGKVNKLNQHISEPFVEINVHDASDLRIHEGQLVEVSSRRGNVRVKAKLSQTIKQGVLFMPMHWGKGLDSDLLRTNNLTNDLLDPISKQPDFKYCSVQIKPYTKEKQHVVIIGAGAGAHGLVKSYRELNTVDKITIFSNEDLPFYNRVMLPHYISGEMDWEQLVKMSDEQELSLDIDHIRGVSITSIDRQGKQVVDSRGIRTKYDVLVLATGSRPALPKNVPKLQGIFTMRKRGDADNLRKYLPKGGHLVIIGGGVLGLEMAASLGEIGIKITIVQRVSRFLNRQLDPLGSQLLHQEMIDQGCNVYYNDEVQLYYGRSKLRQVELKSGQQIQCDAVLLAIGTTPNIELAKQAGLICKRGVIVDHYMRTNDPNIYAIGEIAEFQDVLYGITAAAEEQAEIVARFHNGDVSHFYRGSLFMNILKIQTFDLCSIGITECPNDDYEEIVFIDKAKRYYKKCIVYQDRLVGTILIGDKSEFIEFKNLIAGKIELSEKRLQLLRNESQKDPVSGRLVCTCSQVGEGNLEKAVNHGCSDMVNLCQTTGAGQGCGSCRPEVQAILDRILAQENSSIKEISISHAG